MIAIGTSLGIMQSVQVVGKTRAHQKEGPRELKREAKSLKDNKAQLARTIARRTTASGEAGTCSDRGEYCKFDIVLKQANLEENVNAQGVWQCLLL